MADRRDDGLPGGFAPTVRLRDIRDEGTQITVRPDADQRAAIAGALGVPELRSLAADFHLLPLGAAGCHLTGSIEATVVQPCVVTGQPVEGRIEEAVDVRYLPADPFDNSGGVAHISPDEADMEVLDTDRIDLRAVIMEFLAVGLDPYPHAPGVGYGDRFEDGAEDDPDAGADTPFSVLRGLAGGKGGPKSGSEEA